MMNSSARKIDKRYEILKTLGDGLSGEVLLVYDKDGQKALKFLKKVQFNVSREDALKNFKNEFAILKELNHPNIARILDFGFDLDLQKYYFTSEFVSGRILDEACTGQPLEVVEKILLQVMRALNYLHSRSTFHFDIKPQNVLVEMRDGHPIQAKIIDFGLAGYTSPRKRVGTPAYMAPEVVQGGALDGRTDLYSLGVVIYKILTGVNPFAGRSLKETLENQVEVMPKPPSQINAQIPEYWDHVVMRLLEKNPSRRYAQAALAIRDLSFLSHKPFEVETRDTKLSYLPEKGALIGREQEWQKFTSLFTQIFSNEGTPDIKALIVEGHKGTGKTRLLSEIKYHSQLANVPVHTWSQFEHEENKPDKFILILEEEQVSADDVNALMQQLAKQCCLIVWATPVAPKNWTNTLVLSLKNYTALQLKEYIESVTGWAKTPPKIVDEIYNRTQGNPLFVSEFVKVLLEQDLLCDSSGKWDEATFEDIHIDFDSLHIPDTVEDYLSYKFKQLDSIEKEILTWLAVHDEALHVEQLEQLMRCSQLGDSLSSRLAGLTEKDFIRKTSREATYFFTNLVYVDVILATLSEFEIQSKHENLAFLFRERTEFREFYLSHLGQGADVAKAIRALTELSEKQLAEQNLAKATVTLKQLLHLTEQHRPEESFQHGSRLAEVYLVSQQNEQAAEILLRLKQSLQQQNLVSPDARILKIQDKLVSIFFRLNQLEQAQAIISETQSWLNWEKHPQDFLIFANFAAHLKLKQGQLDEAEKLFEANHKLWQDHLDDQQRLQVTNNRLIDVYLLKKKFKPAIEVSKQNIAILQKAGDTQRLASLYYGLGDVYFRLTFEGENGNVTDDNQLCLENFQTCERIARKLNDYVLMSRAFNGMANLYYERKDYEQALKYYERALAVARKSNETGMTATIALNVSNTHKKLDRLEDAYSYLVYAINTLEDVPDKKTHTWLHLVMCYEQVSDLYRRKGQFEKAHAALDKVDAIMQGKSYFDLYLFAKFFIRGKIYYDQKRLPECRSALEQAKTHAQALNDKKQLEDYLKDIGFESTNAQVAKPTQSVAQRQGARKMSSENNSQSRHDEDLRKIIEINKFINTEHELKPLLKLVLNYALQLSEAEFGFVILLDDDGSLTPVASLNARPEDEEKVSMSIVRMALESGQIINSADAFSDERFDASESIVLNELKSILCLPIKSQNKCVGVVYLDNHYKVSVFENCNLSLLEAFSDQAGIALANARLVSQLKAAQSRLENQLKKTEEELAEVKNLLIEESGVFQSKYSYDSIISKSKEMQDVFKLLDKVTETPLSVFLHGESGTGKELVAKALHYNNAQRNTKRFVAINCGAIPANLMESELFGHKTGSFTGAVRDKKGMFEEAHGGTLFLDEIGELTPELQVKLLRVLQEGEVQRLGDSHPIKVDVRVVSASLRDIAVMVKEGKFREDLYYRLCQMRINLPPLRQRKDDIPALAKHFVKKYCLQNKMTQAIEIPPDFMRALLEHNWPGNIRELESMLHVACALQENGTLLLNNLPEHYGLKKTSVVLPNLNTAHVSTMSVGDLPSLRQSVSLSSTVQIDEHNRFDPGKAWRDYEMIIIAKCYQHHQCKKKPTAETLDLSPSTIYKKIEELNLDDAQNPLYEQKFIYDTQFKMKDYVWLIFQASLKHHDNHPYAAIKQLGVSQGYFYKVIKQVRQDEASIPSVG